MSGPNPLTALAFTFLKSFRCLRLFHLNLVGASLLGLYVEVGREGLQFPLNSLQRRFSLCYCSAFCHPSSLRGFLIVWLWEKGGSDGPLRWWYKLFETL